MKEIKLGGMGGSHVTLVDDEWFEKLNWCHWTATLVRRAIYAYANYPYPWKKGRLVSMHQVVMDGRGEEIDHINNNGLDNRTKNLRFTNNKFNHENMLVRSGDKTSIYKGVSFDRKSGKWAAQITHNREAHHLGLFASEEDAALAYNEAARKLFTTPLFNQTPHMKWIEERMKALEEQEREAEMSKAWDEAQAGMQQASDHIGRVDPGWKDAAREAIFATAKRCRFFIIDDVHDQLRAAGLTVPTNAHGCCLGALMNEARRNGYIEDTGKRRRSSRSASHADLRPVWKSLVFDPDAPAIPLIDATEPRMCRTCGGTRKVENGLCVLCRLDEQEKEEEFRNG